MVVDSGLPNIPKGAYLVSWPKSGKSPHMKSRWEAALHGSTTTLWRCLANLPPCQPFHIIWGCFAHYRQLDNTQTRTLAKGPQSGQIVKNRPKVGGVSWRAASHLLFICGDFPDFGHETKYAPFGMLGKPESTTIIKGAHYRLPGHKRVHARP